MNIIRVQNDHVWQSLKILFSGALLIFLINIFFGFDNSLTPIDADIPRWQLLIHLHGGSVGWITLSAIGIAIWTLTGRREVDAAYESNVRMLVWAAVVIFAGYVVTFGLAFSVTSGFQVALLPIFGTGAVIVLWWSTVYALGQLGQQRVLTTYRIMAALALLTAAIGATIGALLGLERVIGEFLPIVDPDRVGAHAGMMDTYLFLVAATVIEWFVGEGASERWSRLGLAQGVIWAVGAALVPLAFLINAVDQILPIFMITLLLGFLIFVARIGWKAIRMGPMAEGVKPWAFFGAIWLVIYLIVFLYFISQFVAGATEFPGWLTVLFAHAAFVGMMTSLIFGVISAQTWSVRESTLSWGEPAAMWLMNLGLLAFAALKLADTRLGAIVMGLGVLLGVVTFFLRLQAKEA